MGAILIKYYETVGKKGGLQAQMRLAIKTNIPVTKLPLIPDSAELLELFYKAAREIIGSDMPKLHSGENHVNP